MGKDEIELQAETVGECVGILEKDFPDLKSEICENGEVLKTINIYVNGDEISSINGLSTLLKVEDEIDIMSAFAAG